MADDNSPTQVESGTAESGPDRLRKEALDLLDYSAVREAVASRTMFLPARELARSMEPAYDELEVAMVQQETADGLRLLDNAGDIDLKTSEDVSDVVARAALEGVLTGLDLLAVAGLLGVLHRARSSLLRARSSAPLLAGIADGIPELRDVQRRIESCIGVRGEVLDGATPSLGLLRRQVRGAYDDVAAALEGVIKAESGRDALQDQVISMRSDRLVVQVKVEQRHRVPGVVHGASNTGATLFVEPFATVDLGNAWRELALEEERETERVLSELSAIVGAVADDITRGAELTARVDLILARARYSASLDGVAVESPRSTDREDAGEVGARVRLLQARHPLLGAEAVPINLRIGPGWSVLVITGPNTGGKTAAMKTVGFLALMHQSGLHVPADEGSALPVFDGIYADVGDQQSIQESVSTFGSHMRNVIRILSQATPASLVLLDELGTSTDPEEGSALAKAILGNLASRGVATVATTHHRSVAAHAEAASGMSNASVDLDAGSLRPTYHLTLGIPGRSYAMSMAEQMGVPEEIMKEARSLLEPQHLRFEDWLNELQGQRRALQESLEAADRAEAGAEAARREAEEQLRDLTERREEVVQGMRAEMAAQYDEVRKKLRRAEAALSWRSPPGAAPDLGGATEDAVRDAGEELESVRSEVQDIDRRARAERSGVRRDPLAVGDLVDVRGLNVTGTVRSLPETGDEAEVLIGSVRLRLAMSRLMRVEVSEDVEPESAEIAYDLGPAMATVELDLRGMGAEDALIRVEEFLDRALRDGLSSVRIIHGKGTGALRQAVRELLEHHPLARSFGPETPDRGGNGATAVELM